MTAATMIAMHYHIDSTRLALEAGGHCEYLVDAVTGVKGNRSIFCENTIFFSVTAQCFACMAVLRLLLAEKEFGVNTSALIINEVLC